MPESTQNSATARGTTPLRSQRPSQGATQASGDTVMTEAHERNLAIQADVVALFLKRLVNCRSVAQLVALVPAAVQDRTRSGLDDIVNAHIKKASADHLLAEWKDHLAKENYGAILELKSIRGPSIQVSKLAEKDVSISKDFSDALKEAKKSALARMIAIKEQEVEALSKLCNEDRNYTDLRADWKRVANADGVSKEAYSLLIDPDCVLSLIQSSISIGENTAHKQMEKKKQKSGAVKGARTKGTAAMPTEPKALEEFIKEIAKRQKQSAVDKSKARQSGKGQRGAGPSKTKNQRNPNGVGKKNRKRNAGKRGTSSKKQQKKR